VSFLSAVDKTQIFISLYFIKVTTDNAVNCTMQKTNKTCYGNYKIHLSFQTDAEFSELSLHEASPEEKEQAEGLKNQGMVEKNLVRPII